MGRTTIISIVNTNVIVLCCVNIYHKNFLFWGTIKVIVLYCIVLYCIVLYCIVLYCIVLYCIVLYCIVLYCIVTELSQYPMTPVCMIPGIDPAKTLDCFISYRRATGSQLARYFHKTVVEFPPSTLCNTPASKMHILLFVPGLYAGPNYCQSHMF